jgi:hypothetical protein
VGWGVFANFLKTAARQMKDEAIEFDAAQATFSSACSPRTTPYPVLHIIIFFFFAEFIPSCVSPRGSANFHSQLLPVFQIFFFFFFWICHQGLRQRLRSHHMTCGTRNFFFSKGYHTQLVAHQPG